jgi:hypothetical protein
MLRVDRMQIVPNLGAGSPTPKPCSALHNLSDRGTAAVQSLGLWPDDMVAQFVETCLLPKRPCRSGVFCPILDQCLGRKNTKGESHIHSLVVKVSPCHTTRETLLTDFTIPLHSVRHEVGIIFVSSGHPYTALASCREV